MIARNVGLNLMGCFIVAMIFTIGVSEAKNYTVGDSFGWNVPNNESFYEEWARTKTFVVGDSLDFFWKGEHSVGVSSESGNYEQCNTAAIAPLFKSNNGSVTDTVFRYNIVLPTGSRYFVCTVGNHCARGQKFSINVHSSSPAPPPPLSLFPTLCAFISTFALCYFFITTLS